MSQSSFQKLRLVLFKLVQFIAPEGSSLDALFNSYDDWREMREKTSARRGAVATQHGSAAGNGSSASH